MREFKNQNNGIEHILIAVDVFSRRLWAAPLRNTSGLEGVRGLKVILSQIIDNKFMNITCDKGSEFVSKRFKDYVHSLGARLHHSSAKCHIAERAILTLKKIIYRYFSQTDNLNYIDNLQDFVHAYNSHFHRFLQLTPYEADDPKNAQIVSSVHWKKRQDLERKRQKHNKFKIGDTVRISMIRSKLARGFDVHQKYEVFTIYKINRNLPITRYYLKDSNDEKIDGAFNHNELTKTTIDRYKVIILDRRIKRGVNQVFVKWKGYKGNYILYLRKMNVCSIFKDIFFRFTQPVDT